MEITILLLSGNFAFQWATLFTVLSRERKVQTIHLTFSGTGKGNAALCGKDSDLISRKAIGHVPNGASLKSDTYRDRVCSECLRIWDAITFPSSTDMKQLLSYNI